LLYAEIMARLFRMLFELDQTSQTGEHELELVKVSPNGYFEVTAAKDMIVRQAK
jgi:type III restriction enzyme